MEQSVTIERLTVKYHGAGAAILQDVSLALKQGDRFGLIGNNGCGKTTLAHAITGIVPEFFRAQVSGKILVSGCRLEPLTIADRLAHVGFSFQDIDSQILFGTVREILGLNERETNVELMELALDLLELKPLLNHLPSHLSGGQAQRLALATALRCAPSLIVYDEATTALDPLGRNRFCDLARALSERNHTLIMIGQRESLLSPYVDDLAAIINNRLSQGRKFDFTPTLEGYEWESVWSLPWQRSNRSSAVEINISNLFHRRRYVPDFALGPIKTSVERGEVVALIGPNGSGKSTFFELLLGNLRSEKGEVNYVLSDGSVTKDLHKIPLGVLFQNPSSQITGATIQEELSIGLDGKSQQEFEGFLEILNSAFPFIKPKRDPLELSYGQQKVLGLVSLMLEQNGLLLLDEPEQGLDEGHVEFLRQWLASYRESKACTILFATHDLEIAASYADKVWFFDHGQIRAEYQSPSVEQLRDAFVELC